MTVAVDVDAVVGDGIGSLSNLLLAAAVVGPENLRLPELDVFAADRNTDKVARHDEFWTSLDK